MEKMIRFPNLGLEFKFIGSSVRIFGFELTIGGLLLSLGMLLGLAFVVLEAKRANEDQDAYLGMLLTSVITGLIGARALYVVLSWQLYRENLMEVFDIRSGGMSFYGGLLGGILGAALFCAVRRLSFMRMADTASLGLVLAQMIGRWGDLFNRTSFGEYTNSVLAMQLPLSAVRSSDVTAAMRENLVTVDGISFIQVHPVFLYESAWCLVLFLLMLVWKRRRGFLGEVFLRYLTGYGLGRMLFEWLRTDKLCIPGTTFYASLAISTGLFVFCGITVCIRGTMSRKRAQLQKQRRAVEFAAEERARREAERLESLGHDDVKTEAAAQEQGNPAESLDTASEQPAHAGTEPEDETDREQNSSAGEDEQ